MKIVEQKKDAKRKKILEENTPTSQKKYKK